VRLGLATFAAGLGSAFAVFCEISAAAPVPALLGALLVLGLLLAALVALLAIAVLVILVALLARFDVLFVSTTLVRHLASPVWSPRPE
jgi:hypothetical protein